MLGQKRVRKTFSSISIGQLIISIALAIWTPIVLAACLNISNCLQDGIIILILDKVKSLSTSKVDQISCRKYHHAIATENRWGVLLHYFYFLYLRCKCYHCVTSDFLCVRECSCQMATFLMQPLTYHVPRHWKRISLRKPTNTLPKSI